MGAPIKNNDYFFLKGLLGPEPTNNTVPACMVQTNPCPLCPSLRETIESATRSMGGRYSSVTAHI